jgi:large subunit ribosomal protein L19
MNFTPVNIEARKKLDLRAGDSVRVIQKIEEKGKTRLQTFEGLVLARKHGKEAGATFTVRRVKNGMGVEKIFPLYSPIIDQIEIIKRSKVRRSKLYYVRRKAAKEISKRLRMMMVKMGLADEEAKQEVIKAKEAAEATLEVAEEKTTTEEVVETTEEKAEEVVEEETPAEEVKEEDKKEA